MPGCGNEPVCPTVPRNEQPAVAGFESLNEARAVNDREWIVGWGLNSGWAYRGFILRPNE
jgi:hypothetical protein